MQQEQCSRDWCHRCGSSQEESEHVELKEIEGSELKEIEGSEQLDGQQLKKIEGSFQPARWPTAEANLGLFQPDPEHLHLSYSGISSHLEPSSG